MAVLDQKVGQMGARHHFRIGRQRQRAFVSAADAFFRQLFGHRRQPRHTPLPHLCQQRLQRGILFVKIQPDDVHAAAAPGNRNLDAVNQADTALRCFGTRFSQTPGVIVVGQRQYGTAVLFGQPHHFGGA